MRIRRDIPPPPPPDKEYDEDFQWMIDNTEALSKAYPDQWVAIADKQVVACGKTMGEAIKKARKKGRRENCVVDFMEGELYIYANQLDVQH
jgi:hypothetical protein